MSIIAFGEVLWDVYPDEKCLGGAPLNFAAHFAKLGGSAYILSSIGNDEFCNETINKIKSLGVSDKYLHISGEFPTGVCNVSLNANAIPTYRLEQNVAYDYIPCDNINDNFDVLYFGTLSLRNGFNRNSLSALISNNSFKEIFVDLNIRPPYYSDDTIDFCLKNATIVKISDEELPTVNCCININEIGIEESAKRIYKKYPNLKQIIITKGSKGAFCYDAAGDICYNCNAVKINVVSTVGAGDSFSAAFLNKFLSGEGIENCLKFAAKVSAYVCSKKDAVPD